MRERSAFYRRAAIGPICLCLVACLHMVRVYGYQQTPWKGGGFGMFSTTDGLAARSLRCYLVVDSGVGESSESEGGEAESSDWELAVAVPPELEKRAAELRAAPSEAGVHRFAKRLAEVRWVAVEPRWEAIAAQVQRTPSRPATASMLHPSQPNRLPQRRSGTATAVTVAKRSDRHTIPIRKVRVELWRSDFDLPSRRINAVRQFQAEVTAEVIAEGTATARSEHEARR